MPLRYIDAGPLEITRKPEAVVELQTTARSRMVHPAGQELPGEPGDMLAVDLACPLAEARREASSSQEELQRCQLEPCFKSDLRDVMKSRVPKVHSVHNAHASVVKALQSSIKLLSQVPDLAAMKQDARNQAFVSFFLVHGLDHLRATEDETEHL
mgnify:CR=1 FL=1